MVLVIISATSCDVDIMIFFTIHFFQDVQYLEFCNKGFISYTNFMDNYF